MHSCALYDSPRDSLESAQARSLRSICEQLELGPGDRVLEIGTGWGALAEFAATHYGCHITTTTVSRAQYDVAQQRLRGAGVRPDQVAVRLEDYRAVRGRFDKIVSIEMFETVGLDHYDTFFEACDRMLLPHGTMLLQTSTVDDWRFGDYLRTPSWAATYIFPGVELASVSRILASLARLTTLRLESISQLESHYALTVREWRRRFLTRAHDARALGFGDEFIRAWDLYLACCEAAFRSYHIGNAQLLLAKPGAVAAAFARPKCAVA